MADRPPLKIAVMVSGRGSNVQAILDRIGEGRLNARIVLMISSSTTAIALTIARDNNIPSHTLTIKQFSDEQEYVNSLLRLFEQHQTELIVLAGYLKMIPAQVVEHYRGRMINIHPALLPAFGGKGLYGRHVHEAVLAYGCKISGATVHLVEAEYDTGMPLIQRCVPVLQDDNADTLAARVLTVEHQILSEAIQLFADDRIKIRDGRAVILTAKP